MDEFPERRLIHQNGVAQKKTNPHSNGGCPKRDSLRPFLDHQKANFQESLAGGKSKTQKVVVQQLELKRRLQRWSLCPVLW